MLAYVCLPLADGWFHCAGLTATLMAVLSAMILFAHRGKYRRRNRRAVGATRGCAKTGINKIMNPQEPLVFKVATEDWEFEEIHRLNYRTFVEEIPQHQPSAAQRLVDKFHAENTYLICLGNRKLVGMLAVRGQRPSRSIKKCRTSIHICRRGDDLRNPAARHRKEIPRRARRTGVARHFGAALAARDREGYYLAIISGTTRQFKLYHHLGFVPFGPLVGSGEARFQPMMSHWKRSRSLRGNSALIPRAVVSSQDREFSARPGARRRGGPARLRTTAGIPPQRTDSTRIFRPRDSSLRTGLREEGRVVDGLGHAGQRRCCRTIVVARGPRIWF